MGDVEEEEEVEEEDEEAEHEAEGGLDPPPGKGWPGGDDAHDCDACDGDGGGGDFDGEAHGALAACESASRSDRAWHKSAHDFFSLSDFFSFFSFFSLSFLSFLDLKFSIDAAAWRCCSCSAISSTCEQILNCFLAALPLRRSGATSKESEVELGVCDDAEAECRVCGTENEGAETRSARQNARHAGQFSREEDEA
jgi:hypothetical protein